MTRCPVHARPCRELGVPSTPSKLDPVPIPAKNSLHVVLEDDGIDELGDAPLVLFLKSLESSEAVEESGVVELGRRRKDERGRISPLTARRAAPVL